MLRWRRLGKQEIFAEIGRGGVSAKDISNVYQVHLSFIMDGGRTYAHKENIVLLIV